MKKRLYDLLMDQEHVTRLTAGSLATALEATPEELMDLARDHDVLDAVDKAWSILVMLAAPAAVARLRASLHSDDEKVADNAARELLRASREASKHQLEQARNEVHYQALQKKRAPQPTDTKDIASIIEQARRITLVTSAQKGSSSSEDDDPEPAGGE